MRIVYPNDTGGVSVIIPSPNWVGTMEELAAKDVPNGKAYKIVEDSAVPTDRAFRDAWEYTANAAVEKSSADLSAEDLAKYNMSENL